MHRSVVVRHAFLFLIVGIALDTLFPALEKGIPYLAVLVGVGIFILIIWGRRHGVYALYGIFFILGMIRAGGAPIVFSFLNPATYALESVRDSFVSNITYALPEPHASYLAGLLVGARSTMPYTLKRAFQATGLAHVTALSGYNVTIIGQYLFLISGSLLVASIGIVLFVLATGASSSLVRAAIMGTLTFVARGYGYEYRALHALLFALTIMVFISPQILFTDIGFQLSILATWGIIVLAPRIQKNKYIMCFPERFGIREIAATTLAAQLATLPLVLHYFGAFSPYAPLVNILVLGVVPLTMLCGFLVGLAGYVSGLLALIIAWPTYLLLSYQLAVVQFFAHLYGF